MVYILLNASPSDLSPILTAESLDMVIKITRHDGCSSKDLFGKNTSDWEILDFVSLCTGNAFPGGQSGRNVKLTTYLIQCQV